VRWWNQKHPATYSASLAGGALPIGGQEMLSDADRHTEAVMLQIRMRSGIDVEELSSDERERADAAVVRGLLECDGRSYVLTDAGRLLADGVVRDILVD